MDFEWRLRAAAGYAELGMNRESMAELNAIEMPSQAIPEVLQLRLHHLMREKKWTRALTISRALLAASEQVKAGIKQANRLVATMQNMLLDPGKLGRIHVSIDYVGAVDPITLKHVDFVTGPTLLAIAARVGNTRLIDNIVVTPT